MMKQRTISQQEIQYLKGVGPKKSLAFKSVGINTFEDLLYYFPRTYLDRTGLKSIGSLIEGDMTTVVGIIHQVSLEGHVPRRKRLKVALRDKTGFMELVWFQGAGFLEKKFQRGDALAVFGKVGFFNRTPQMTHPEFDHLSDADENGNQLQNDYELFNTGQIVALYPLTEALKKQGITSRILRQQIKQVYETLNSHIQENLSIDLIRNYQLMPLCQALKETHFPTSKERLNQALYRLKWSELFFLQLLFALRQKTQQKRHAKVFEHVGEFTQRLYASLPFEMTDAQKNVIREIRKDLKSGIQMNRLVQGDVGSGKTLVGLFAMMVALDNGVQCAFMAPTEILATQHYLTMKKMVEPLGIEVALLVGKQRKKERENVLSGLSDGRINICIGTHALIEEGVAFHELGLVIIDEQHRFGVMQRKKMHEKSLNPHMLLMTATPIPRTLTMTVYGDLNVSVINEMPKNRKSIITRLRYESEEGTAFNHVAEEIQNGRQAYVVFPLVEESEKMDLAAAKESYERIKADFKDICDVALIHGQMKSQEKDAVMERFSSGKTKILVGTTVIEVGVDVPNASIILIEHAERFGLSQLHQLRGRVGRGKHQSYCYLMYSKLSQEARVRLKAMEESSDGFKISEIDARLRGAGNIMGTEQSGIVNDLKIANLNEDLDILISSRSAAFQLIEHDPELKKDGHEMIKSYFSKHYHNKSILADIG